MKSQRLLSLSVVVLLMVCMIVPAASAQSKPVAGTKAGSITALLPVATIDRGTGKNKTTVEAKKGDDVVWNDLVKTQKGGRARITLTDTSVLSLGSQAELRILKHDSRTQQTALQLAYGRVRAEVASVTRDGGKFELRTPTAVAGVIGTDFGTDSSIPGVTTFLCIAGIVTVGNVDSKVPGTVPCPAGSTTSVSTGLPPTPPKPATQEQIQKLIQDTSAAVISSISPASAFQGKTLVAAVSGTKMTGISEVTISGAGVMVSLPKPSTETSLEISLQIDADAPAGPRTINFTKSNGQSASSIFTVLAPPKEGGVLDIPALQKAYLDIIEQERLSEIAGLNAIGVGVQQSAGETLAMILEENKKNPNPLDQDKIEQHLGQDMAPMLAALDAAGKKVNEDTANAAKDFLTKTTPKPPAPPDFAKVLKDTFEKINAELLAKFKLTHDALGKEALATNAKFVGTPDWLRTLQSDANVQKITPKSDADERALDQGLMAAFDASRSKGSGNSSIAGFNWVLCDPSYKPQQVGVPLPANDTKCHPLSGYASSASDFRFQTCNLAPQDYIVRVYVMDDKQKAAAMDMRLRVLKGEYEDPTTRLQSAAAAFQTLQSERFMAFFDTSFANYGSLSETIRRTFEGLASMTINLRVSQASINCNEATVRADWQQNYTFKDDQSCSNLPAGNTCQRVVFTQTEQLTSRLIRVADASGSRILGWNIVDFQGDNGTVQGTPPGPRTVDVALPDLEIDGLAPVQGGKASHEGAPAVTQGIAPGLNAFEAIVRNLGTGPLSAPAKIRFVALGPNNVEVASDVEDVPIPLSIGGSVSVIGRMTIPDLGAGVPIRITATVNPGCVVPEKNCDGSNIQLLDLLIGIIDLKLSNVTQVGTLIGTLPGAVTVDITNIGSQKSLASVNNLKLGPAANNLITAGVSVPAIAPGQTVTINVPFTVPNASGAQTIVAGFSPRPQFDFNSANDFATGSINITAAKVDLQLSNLAFSAGTPLAPPFASGQSHTVTFNVKNVGNVASSIGDSYSCKLVSPTFGTTNFTPVTLPSVGAGLTVTGLTFTFLVPIDFTGSDTLTCAVSQDPFEAVATLTDNQASLAAQVNPNIDLQLVNVPVPTSADQMGGNSNVSFGVKNFGLDTAAAGYNVVLTINGNQVTTTTGPAVVGGATVPITINYVTPQIGVAPQDVTVPATLQVNANAAVTETNTSNNTVSRTLHLVDFTLSTIPTGPLSAVAGRSFNSTVIQVLPTTYPLSLNVFYTGAPAGLTNAGSQSANIIGTQLGSNQIIGAPGSYTITASATVQGVTHTSNTQIGVNLLQDIVPSLVGGLALNAGGTPQSFQVAVTGGVNPVTLTLTLPTGVTLGPNSPTPTNSTIISSPATVSWDLQSDVTAAIGNALTNIVVTATDPGIGANNVNAGNKVFAPPYSNGGFDNYVITGASLAAPHTTGTGTDAFQLGETVTFNVDVKNIGNLGQTGSIALQVSCTPACGTPGATIPAPAPNGTTTATIVMPVTSAPNSYNGTISILSAPPQSTTADDNLTNFPFEIFDFSLTNNANFAPYQNVPLNGSANFGIFVNESGPGASIPIFLPLTVTNTGSTGTNAPSSVQGGLSYNIAMFRANPGVLSGTLDTVTATSTRLGITKSASQPIKYFTASLDNITSGGLGDSSATHKILPVSGGGVTLTFKLTGDFDATTAGTLAVNTANGITTQVNLFTGVPSNTFDVVFTPAAAGGTIANGTETVIDLVYTVPNTNPVQQIVKHVYFLPVNSPDLSVQTASNPSTALSLVPAGISSSRNFNGTDPLISGEGAEFTVKVFNTGAGASSPNLKATIYLGTTILNQTTLPSIPGNSFTTFLVHVRAPEPVATACCNSITLTVDSDPLEINTGNNFQGYPIATSDWSLALVGSPNGDTANPLVMAPNTLGGTIVKAVTTLAGGLVATPITVITAGVSTTISGTAPVGALTPPTAGFPPQGNVTIATGLASTAGNYAVQLVGRVTDGGVTSQRGATVHINVPGTVNPVTITSSINNALPSNPPSSCSGPCIVRQINGYLVDSLDITATGGTGTVDLVFTDDPAIVSNVSVPSGSPGPQYLNAVPYNSLRTINFAPLDNNGAVTAGPANVVISAAAATTAARGGPIQEKVGTQQTTLYFNIGDLLVSPSSTCSLQIAPGGTTHVVMNFIPVSGFNQATLFYNWTSFGGALVTLAQSSSGTSTFLNPGYTTATFDFTNHEVANINSTVVFNLDVTIQSTNGSQATKHFAIPAFLSSSICGSAAHREGTVAGNSFASSAGYWTRGSGGGASSASVRREASSTSSTMPDLQIKSTDVSVSPSVPKSGDKIDVRFKVTNAGGGAAKQVPIALQVNGVTVASDKYDLGAGASTLAALQWVAKVPDPNIQLDRARRSPRGGGDTQDVPPPAAPNATGSGQGFDAKLVIDPAGTVPQATNTFKAVQLSKMMLRGGPAEPATVMPMDRVFLEVGTICVGFRLASGSGSECESGADVDLSIVDFATSRFELIAQLGIADLGAVNAGAANLSGAQFGSRASLIVGHTYAVQLAGNKVGLMTIVRQLTPMQLAAEAKRRFGRSAIRIVSRLGGSTGAVEAGDVSGVTRAGSDALTYFELAFSAQQ